ncbi:MAG TPA: GDP-mannose 4,6-dehydratase [Verrucomicrobiae bacterium]|jgi:UDP-glucuronate 4-epimerase
MNLLVTGGAGFIGSHLIDRLLGEGHEITCVENFDDFYDVSVKEANLRPHRTNSRFHLINVDVRDLPGLRAALPHGFDAVIHLAAKAGVRPSILDPISYQEVNIRGTHNLLELARERRITQFVFGSSSSVYGISPNVPWREDDVVLKPISPYAATKVSGELLGHVYSHLFGIRFIALRFFTVYGPRQRPDLAIHKFTRLIADGKPVPVFGDGTTSRDYTYVADIVQGICAALGYRRSMYEVINLGNNQPVTLNELLATLEGIIGRKIVPEKQPEQPGDVPRTCADITKAQTLLGYAPQTSLHDGCVLFWNWFQQTRQVDPSR